MHHSEHAEVERVSGISEVSGWLTSGAATTNEREQALAVLVVAPVAGVVLPALSGRIARAAHDSLALHVRSEHVEDERGDAGRAVGADAKRVHVVVVALIHQGGLDVLT